MDDDDYPLSDTDDLSTTAELGDTARRRQTGGLRQRSDASLQRIGEYLTAGILMERHNQGYALPPVEERLSDNDEDDDDDDDDDDEGIAEETANLLVSQATDAAVAGDWQGSVGFHSNNSHRQIYAAGPSTRPVDDLGDYPDNEWRYSPRNNNASPDAAAHPSDDLMDMDDVSDPNDGGSPRNSPASATIERGEDMSTAPPPDNSSVFSRSSASTNNNNNPPTPGGEQSLCNSTTNLSLNADGPHNVHGSVAGGEGGRSSGSDSPSPSTQQGERCGEFEDDPNTNTEFDGAMDIDEESVDFNDGGNPRDDEGNPRDGGEDRGDVEEEQFAMPEEEEAVFEDVAEEELVEGDEREFLLGYRQLLSEIHEIHETVGEVYEELELVDLDGIESEDFSDARQILEEVQLASPLLPSPQGAASRSDFAPSPISHPLPAARDGSVCDTPRGDQDDCVGDARNESFTRVDELGRASLEAGLAAKVLFEDEADDKSGEIEEDDTGNVSVICDECQGLTVLDKVVDQLGIGNTWCCQRCNVSTLLLSQTTEGSVASSHRSNYTRPSMNSLHAADYDYVNRGVNKTSKKITTYIAKIQNLREYGVIFTIHFGSGQAAQLALQCLLLARDSTINPDDNSVNWIGVHAQLRRPYEEWKSELNEDVNMLLIINDEVARKHLSSGDIRGEGNVVATCLNAVAKYLDTLTATKRRNWGLDSAVLKKIVEVLREMAVNTDSEEAEFPWLASGHEKPHGFPDKEEWREESDKLQRKLNKLENGNEPLPYRENDFFRKLEAVAAHFCCEVTDYCNPSPPSIITKTTVGCPYQRMADYSLSALFEGLLCDPECSSKNFNGYLDANPSQMSPEAKKAASLEFHRDTGVLPDWYTPAFLGNSVSLNASPAEIEHMKGYFKSIIGSHENVKRLQEERQRVKDMDDYFESLRDKHIHRCKVEAKQLRELIDRYCNKQSAAPLISLATFKVDFTRKLRKIDGLDKLSADSFASLRSADESIWRNEGDRYNNKRRSMLSKLLCEVFGVLYPTEVDDITLDKNPGDCPHPNCDRNILDGCAFHGAHIDDTEKNGEPCMLARQGSEMLLKELEGPGYVPKCTRHHDGSEEKREFPLDASKYHLLSPPQRATLGRGQGRDFLQILQKDRVLRLKYCLFIMDCYCRRLLGTGDTRTRDECDYNTLRVMFLAYFDTIADDVMIPSANEWNTCKTKKHVRYGLKHVVQNHCGVCYAANQPGTLEARNKEPENWEIGDYACHETNFNFQQYAPAERERIEGDHTYSREVSGRKQISVCTNVFEMLDEIPHAPFHCLDCHKRRTSNQDQRKHYRDYTVR